MTNKEELNDFFVSCFNQILRVEESELESIANSKMTMKEIHFIEAVFKTKEKGENYSTTIANRLNVTLGTLTTNFMRLERKGCLTKRRCNHDKRVFYIEPTPLAEFINKKHQEFHNKMIDDVLEAIPVKQADCLVGALKALNKFFSTYKLKNR